MKRVWFICLFLAATRWLPAEDADVSSAILASYVAVSYSAIDRGPVVLVRAITDIKVKTSPTLLVDHKTTTMQTRSNPDPNAFPVTVWESVAPLGASLKLEGKTLPSARKKPATVAVFGDSGCKSSQGCDVADNWPLPNMAENAAVKQPDLVLHMGDYNYRGTPSHSPPGNTAWVYDGCGTDYLKQDTQGMEYGNDWPTWQLDFFEPMAELMAAAPFVLTRGNHELCARAGTGFFYLLDPGSTLLNKDYKSNPCSGVNVYTAPAYHLDLGNINLLMTDTANLCGWDVDSDEIATYTQIYSELLAKAAATRSSNWLIGHRPLWSVTDSTANQKVPQVTGVSAGYTQTMAKILEQKPLSDWTTKIGLMISGHVHQFQYILPMQNAGPPQLVVGNSGVRLNKSNLNGPIHGNFDEFTPNFSALGSAFTQFGYLWMEVNDTGGWDAQLYGMDGQVIVTINQ